MEINYVRTKMVNLAFINWNVVAELSASPDLQIIPTHQSKGLSVVILLGRVESQRIVTVICDVLKTNKSNNQKYKPLMFTLLAFVNNIVGVISINSILR